MKIAIRIEGYLIREYTCRITKKQFEELKQKGLSYELYEKFTIGAPFTDDFDPDMIDWNT